MRDKVAAGTLAVFFMEASIAWAQASSSPTRTQCKQWDDAYLGAFTTGFWVCGIATLVLALVAGLLGRLSWTAAAPRLRILIVALAVVVLVEVGLILLPWTLGFGWLWFSAIDTTYFDCIPKSFGAEGFFAVPHPPNTPPTGLIGPGVAAIAQWPTMIYLLMIPAVAAGLLAWLVNELAARFFGLRRQAQKEGA
jgi:hypothetical protein